MDIDELRSPAECRAIMELLRDENASLKAEVERLTPNPMTLEEACDVVNRLNPNAGWTVINSKAGNPMVILNVHSELVTDEHAIYIAQGLLRDAGPLAVQETAKRKDTP